MHLFGCGICHQLPHTAGFADVADTVIEYQLANVNGQLGRAALGPGEEAITNIDKFLTGIWREMHMQGKAGKKFPGHLN